MPKLRDKLWIWGHPTNSFERLYGLDVKSYMSPLEGMEYLGARNMFYVPMGREHDKVKISMGLMSADRLGFSLQRSWRDDSEIDELIALSKRFPNVTLGIFDDFFNEENTGNNSDNYPPQLLARLRQKLHAAAPKPIEMWMVAYTKHFGKIDMRTHIRQFDGASMWFWNEDDSRSFDERVKYFIELTTFSDRPDVRRLIGLYLYDFGDDRPADPGLVIMQLEKNRELIKAGLTDGVILHTNAIADLGFEAVERARQWIIAHGDEEI